MWRSVGFTRTVSYPLAANPRKQQFYPIESARFRRILSERHAPLCDISNVPDFFSLFFFSFFFLTWKKIFLYWEKKKILNKIIKNISQISSFPFLFFFFFCVYFRYKCCSQSVCTAVFDFMHSSFFNYFSYLLKNRYSPHFGKSTFCALIERVKVDRLKWFSNDILFPFSLLLIFNYFKRKTT